MRSSVPAALTLNGRGTTAPRRAAISAAKREAEIRMSVAARFPELSGRKSRLETFQAPRDERAVSIAWQMLKGGDAAFRREGGVRRSAGSEVAIPKIEV